MALNQMGLGFNITARDFASAPLQRVDRNFRTLDRNTTATTTRMAGNLKRVAVGMAAVTAASGAMAFGVFKLAGKAGEFEQGLAAVGAVTKATTAQMDQLSAAAKKAGIETQFSPTEAVDGLQSLATAGQTVNQATKTLIPVLDLAAGSLGQLGVAESAEAVVGTLNAYDMAADQATNTTDKLLRITQLTNFQTRDFQVGLSKAAAAGAAFKQPLDDVLISMGLLRNRNIEASVASTSLREAFTRLAADQRAQEALSKAGVKAFDAETGATRNAVDVMTDLAEKTADMTDKQRNALVVQAFGRRGLLAFQAVQSASFTTMRDGVEVTLKGRDAIAAMRKEMGAAGGTAADFREKLLDTFEGQKTLLKGSVETLLVTLGEPLARGLKPLVTQILNFVNRMQKAFSDLPESTKERIGQVAVAIVGLAGALASLSGGGIALFGVVKGIGLLMSTLSALAGLALPVLGILAALAAVGGTLYVIWTENLGGFREFVVDAWQKIKLAFQGLVQLFRTGGFSGAVMEEMQKAENSGVRRFVISIFRFAHRVKKFLIGIKEGFVSTLETLRPVFDRLKGALVKLLEAIGFSFADASEQANGMESDRFKSWGKTVGNIAAEVVGFITRMITIAVKFQTGWVKAWRKTMKIMRPIAEGIGRAVVKIGEQIKDILVKLGLVDEGALDSGDQWEAWGNVIGTVISRVAAFILKLVEVSAQQFSRFLKGVRAVIDFISGEGSAKTQIFGASFLMMLSPIAGVISMFVLLYRAVKWVVDAVISAVKRAAAAIRDFFIGPIEEGLEMARSVPGLGTALDAVGIGGGGGGQAFSDRFLAEAKVGLVGRRGLMQVAQAGGIPELLEQQKASMSVPSTQVDIEAGGGDGLDDIIKSLDSMSKSAKEQTEALKAGTLFEGLTVELDGEKVGALQQGRATDNAIRGGQSTPVPTF